MGMESPDGQAAPPRVRSRKWFRTKPPVKFIWGPAAYTILVAGLGFVSARDKGATAAQISAATGLGAALGAVFGVTVTSLFWCAGWLAHRLAAPVELLASRVVRLLGGLALIALAACVLAALFGLLKLGWRVL